MRTIEFAKMHGAGNDYVLVSALHDPAIVADGPALARCVSDRHFGIGSDGLIVVTRSDRADVRMHMWNADGSRGAMCGNGLRCVAKLARESGAVGQDVFEIESDVGVHRTEVRSAAGEVVEASVAIGRVEVEAEDRVLDVAGSSWRTVVGSAGNPHAVLFVDVDLDGLDVARIGRAFQEHPAFEDGVNVEFVRIMPPDRLAQRTFERGSGETLACGSGATAAACAAISRGLLAGPRVVVALRGGEVVVECDDAGHCTLSGPVACPFRGVIRL